MKRLQSLVKKLEKQNAFLLILEMAVICFVLNISAAYIAMQISDFYSIKAPAQQTVHKYYENGGAYLILGLFSALVLSPLIETLLEQLAPINITMKLSKNIGLAILISALVFVGFHFKVELVRKLILFPVGLVLALTFVV